MPKNIEETILYHSQDEIFCERDYNRPEYKIKKLQKAFARLVKILYEDRKLDDRDIATILGFDPDSIEL